MALNAALEIAATSLGRVGHEVLAERLGRNQRLASIGGLTAATVLGVIDASCPLEIASFSPRSAFRLGRDASWQ